MSFIKEHLKILFLICIISTWIWSGLQGSTLGDKSLKCFWTGCHSQTPEWKTTTCVFPESNTGMPVLPVAPQQATQGRCYVMCTMHILYIMPSKRLCHLISPAQEQSCWMRSVHTAWAVSSGLGVDGAACSPCPTLHLGPLKPFLIARL